MNASITGDAGIFPEGFPEWAINPSPCLGRRDTSPHASANAWQWLGDNEDRKPYLALLRVALDRAFWEDIRSDLEKAHGQGQVEDFFARYWTYGALNNRQVAIFGEAACNYPLMRNLRFLLSIRNANGPNFRRYAESRGYTLTPQVVPPSTGNSSEEQSEAIRTVLSRDLAERGPPPRRGIEPTYAFFLEIGQMFYGIWQRPEDELLAYIANEAKQRRDANPTRPRRKHKKNKAHENETTGDEPFSPEERVLRFIESISGPSEDNENKKRIEWETANLTSRTTEKIKILVALKQFLLENHKIPTGSDLIRKVYGKGEKDSKKRQARKDLLKLGFPPPN